MSVSYRNAVVADAAALAALFRSVFLDTFGHLYAPQDVNAFFADHGDEHWAAQLADAAFAVRLADAGTALAGYSKLGPLKLPVDTGAPAIELRQLYVSSDWHGQGIAAALMDWTLEEAAMRGARELYLSVYTDNHRARRFYQRYGFDEVGPYKFMVGNQADDDIIMRKAL